MEFYEFPLSWEWLIIPTDEVIFFRGVGQPPTRLSWSQLKQFKKSVYNTGDPVFVC